MKPGERQLSEHLDAARKRVSHLHALARKTEVAERAILAGAQARLEAVERDIKALRPRALLDQVAGDRYADLVKEAGTLKTVIAESQRVLGR